jgi:hypothetical protein
MRGFRKPYPPELRQQLVELVGAGRTPEELSREFEPSAQSSPTGSPRPIAMAMAADAAMA